MKNLLFLAFQYLRFYKIRSVILLVLITSILYLPLSIRLISNMAEDFLNSRADSTPLIAGTPGSESDLVLGSLYYMKNTEKPMKYSFLETFKHDMTVDPVPLHFMHTLRNRPLLGTTPAYFRYRNLSLSEGEWPVYLGEFVAGSSLVKELNLSVGDRIITDPDNPFHLAGNYPLELELTGILEQSFSPDDQAALTDIKTSWVIQGLGHGHENLFDPGSSDLILSQEEDSLVANSAVKTYIRIDSENRGDFHFHGESDDFPVNSYLLFPRDAKAEALLLAKYEGHDDIFLTEPDKVITRFLESLFRVKEILNWLLWITISVSLLSLGFIISLSIKMRDRERKTVVMIGGSRSFLFKLTLLESGLLLLLAILFSSLLLGLTWLGREFFLEYLIG